MAPSRRAPGSAPGLAARRSSDRLDEVVHAGTGPAESLHQVELARLDTFYRQHGTMAPVG